METIIIFLVILNYALSLIVFPFKSRENYADTFRSPINKTEIPIIKYLHHLLNDIEFVSEIDVGTPKQKVELIFNFDSNYLALLYHTTSVNPYYYNMSSSYKEIKINDKDCPLKVDNSATIKEIFHIKNEFYNNLEEFNSSKEEISHEFIIIFNKYLPTLKSLVPGKYYDSNAVDIGILVNTKYEG